MTIKARWRELEFQKFGYDHTEVLTTDQVMQIYKEVMLDLPPSITTKKACEVRARIVEEAKQAKDKGQSLDFPGNID